MEPAAAHDEAIRGRRGGRHQSPRKARLRHQTAQGIFAVAWLLQGGVGAKLNQAAAPALGTDDTAHSVLGFEDAHRHTALAQEPGG